MQSALQSFIISGYLACSVFASTRSSMLGLNSSEEANLSVACKCSSLTHDLNADLLNFIDEKNCSYT